MDELKIKVPVEAAQKVDFDSLLSGLDEQLVIAEDNNVLTQEVQLQQIDSLINIKSETQVVSQLQEITNQIQATGIIQEIKEEIVVEESIFKIAEDNSDIAEDLMRINKERKHKKITNFLVNQAKFFTHYVIVTIVTFIILLGTTNYQAYSKIAYNFINPDNLKNSSAEILNAIDNSRIKVYADEDSSILWKEQQDKIKKNLAESNLQLRDTYFSPKKLVPLKSNVNLDVEIMPYENRIIIPKLGKNIPLVDVDSRRWWLDFVNLENLFMKELEKWVLRYPWTAKPGENGNVFVFWHSSNYAWEKWDYNDVFALLDNLEFGDEIYVYYNQKKYTYVINEKKVVKPGNVKILERDPNKKELSLMTCRPIGTSINRLITFAELKEVK